VAPMQITINDQVYEAHEGETVLDVARRNDVSIPTLCYDERAEPFGGCRLCIVEIEGLRGLPPACCTPATDGMVVRTHTEQVERMRRIVLELLLSDHPSECLLCEKNGACTLQDLAYEYGVDGRSMGGDQHPLFLELDCNPFIDRDYSKCILCGRCVRVCEGVQGNAAIDFAGRGFEAHIATPFDSGLMDSACELCGQCVDACPVGALTDRKRKGLGRAKDLARVRTTCCHCGVGCGLYLLVREGRICGVEPDFGAPANQGSLCVKGRYAYDFVHSEDRLKTPLIRRDGELQPATWEEALSHVAERMQAIKAESGLDAFAGWASSCATNEANYLFQRFMRAVVGTNNVDNCARQ